LTSDPLGIYEFARPDKTAKPEKSHKIGPVARIPRDSTAQNCGKHPRHTALALMIPIGRMAPRLLGNFLRASQRRNERKFIVEKTVQSLWESGKVFRLIFSCCAANVRPESSHTSRVHCEERSEREQPGSNAPRKQFLSGRVGKTVTGSAFR